MPPHRISAIICGMLAVEPSIDWIDCQARKDVMNFYQFDPIKSHGIDVGTAGRNPTIVPVRFRDIVRAGPLRALPLAILPRPFPVRDGQ